MQSIGNVWVEKYVIAEEQNVARSIEMYLSRTPAAITPLGLVGNPVLKVWSNGHMLTLLRERKDSLGAASSLQIYWNALCLVRK